jgi:cyclohexa-1,5-dienecarbonyl-CoA hydratase
MSSAVEIAFDADQSRAALTFSHPKGNIITGEIVDALRSALESVESNPHLKLITIEGRGDDFSFGASIPEHAPDRIADVLPRMHALVDDLLAAPAVTVAVVRGRCLGGGFELALACDFIFAAVDATFALPEIALGVFPPAACALLPMRVGGARATQAILTGDTLSAEQWMSYWLIDLLAPREDLASAVDKWFATHLAPRSAVALRYAAAAARAGLLAHVRGTLPALEQLYLKHLMQTADAAEGVAAFLEKREPRWTDG